MVNWDKYALQWQYYKGLASCIKNELAHVNHAMMLCGLCEQASTINVCYWAQQQEISQDSGKAPMPSNNKKETLDNTKSPNLPDANMKSNKSLDKHPVNLGLNPRTSSFKAAGGSSNSSNSSDAKKPHLEGKLGQDGKLTLEEHQ